LTKAAFVGSKFGSIQLVFFPDTWREGGMEKPIISAGVGTRA
jgi:hypothetical protein